MRTMPLAFGPEPDAGAIAKPEATLLWLLGRHFEPLASPDTLDTLVVHRPADVPQQRYDLAITVAAVLACQFDHVARQSLFIFQAPRRLALRRAMLTECRTDAAFGDGQMPPHMLDTDAPARRA